MASDLPLRYQQWVEQRAALSAQEEAGGPPPGDWHRSDDEAVDLLREAMMALALASIAPAPVGPTPDWIHQVPNLFDPDRRFPGEGPPASDLLGLHPSPPCAPYSSATTDRVRAGLERFLARDAQIVVTWAATGRREADAVRDGAGRVRVHDGEGRYGWAELRGVEWDGATPAAP